ncbi:DNA-directed RNA polymerases I [Paramecium bursaria]
MENLEQSRVIYICGSNRLFNLIECGKDVQLESKDPVRCQCGYRILYKKRRADPKNPPQYELNLIISCQFKSIPHRQL